MTIHRRGKKGKYTPLDYYFYDQETKRTKVKGFYHKWRQKKGTTKVPLNKDIIRGPTQVKGHSLDMLLSSLIDSNVSLK
jgi:hypothetical protein